MTNHLRFSARPSILILFVVIYSVFAGPGVRAQINKPTADIEQAPYYDALGLYNAFKGIPAYSMELTQAENNEANTPGAPVQVKYYKLIETLTGKILQDRVTNPDSVLATLKVASFDEIKPVMASILARNADCKATDPFDTILFKYRDNRFLGELDMNNIVAQRNFAATFQHSLSPVPLFAPQMTGGATSTVILEGLADFYIERINEEVNEAFFVHLNNFLNKYPEVGILFPKSKESLAKVEVVRYQTSLNVLHAAFEEDMKNILHNVTQLATLDKYHALIEQHKELTLLFTACDIAQGLSHSDNAAEILQKIYTAPYMKGINNNYASAIRMASLTSYAMRDIRMGDENKESKGWITMKQMDQLRSDSTLFRLFMGLYAQNARNIVFDDKVDFRAVLMANCEKVLKGQYIIYNFRESVKKINESFRQIKTTKDGVARSSFDYALMTTEEMLKLCDVTVNILPTGTSSSISRQVTKVREVFIPSIKLTTAIFRHLDNKEYSDAIYKTDSLLHIVFTAYKEEVDKAAAGLNRRDKKSEKNNLDKLHLIQQQFVKYGLFIATVAEAKTSSDVKSAIKTFALPKGSSRIKKECKSSLGVNSYVGYYHSWNKQYDGVNLPKEENGLTAPIGFCYSRGHILGGSLSLYAGIIDIGAIFTYKVNSDSSIKSDIQLGQVLSPSIGVIYGLPIIKKYNIPLSIGCNVQWGPRLRSITEQGSSVLPLLTRRINLFIAFDLPIINFYTSRR